MTNRRARYTAAHIANYILRYFHVNKLEITHLKLQKLLYIAYGWNLVLNKEHPRLFDESIQAWKLGPVIPSVYYFYKNQKEIRDGDYIFSYDDENFSQLIPSKIPVIDKNDDQTLKIVNAVIEKYKNVEASDLVKRLHEPGSPWYKIYNKAGNAKGINQPLDDDDIIERSTPVIKEFFREKIKKNQ